VALEDDGRRLTHEELATMLTLKNLVAVGLFVFGSTFLWMTRDFLANPREGSGGLWSVVQVLVFVTIVGFAAAAWAVFKEASWWEPVALVSAVVGFAALVPYVIGVRQVGDAGVQMNIAIHVAGIAAVLITVLVPAVHGWITKRI
jgi:hypothetical protein